MFVNGFKRQVNCFNESLYSIRIFSIVLYGSVESMHPIDTEDDVRSVFR